MDISRGLALKSLGALGATAAAGLGLGLENSPLRNALGLSSTSSNGEINFGTMTEKVGLNCSDDSKECTIGEGNFNVYNDSTKKLTGAKRSSGSGKIKFEENKEGYNQNSKFTIIDGDIDLTVGSSSTVKLEEFATYEIKEQEGNWYFFLKSTAVEGKSRALGLPEGCNIPSGSEEVKCEQLDAEKLKAINFEGKDNISMVSETTATLIIKKVDRGGTDSHSFGSEELNFTFRASNSAEINGASGNATKLLKNTDLDFMINNNWKLERVWKGEKLKTFIGGAFPINLTNKSGTVSKRTQINVIVGADLIGLEFEVENLKVTIEEDQEGYNQGIKLKFDKDTSLGTKSNGVFSEKYKLLSSASYEIKSGTFDEEERRYLSVK